MNNSTQYIAVVGYTSGLSGLEETIKIEIGLRETLLISPLKCPARTLLLDPVSRGPWLPPVEVLCISPIEAFAEKFRAALSRRELAARDFFDLDYAVRMLGLRTDDPELIKLVRQKLAVPGNPPVIVSTNRLAELKRQVATQLQPVLRAKDIADFDTERAFRILADMSLALT